jgi:hypothetical protein
MRKFGFLVALGLTASTALAGGPVGHVGGLGVRSSVAPRLAPSYPSRSFVGGGYYRPHSYGYPRNGYRRYYGNGWGLSFGYGYPYGYDNGYSNNYGYNYNNPYDNYQPPVQVQTPVVVEPPPQPDYQAIAENAVNSSPLMINANSSVNVAQSALENARSDVLLNLRNNLEYIRAAEKYIAVCKDLANGKASAQDKLDAGSALTRFEGDAMRKDVNVLVAQARLQQATTDRDIVKAQLMVQQNR